ncbi:MAG: acylneuraminate cytidylyltransferase family protein [Halobacteriovoraceae bacterium]|nr:acylneuraminate cytidylyltransferase family protein [Halobacteriovoraceae bacterium]
MNHLCTICARAGSKGLKNKNLLELCDIPLIAHTILQAKNSGLFDLITVSSDSDQILEVAKTYGADLMVKRPLELASDKAGKLPAIKHAFKESEKHTQREYQFIIDLDATSPLRSKNDIVDALNLLKGSSAHNLISGVPSRRSPYFNLLEQKEDGYIKISKQMGPNTILRRQDAPKTYDANASIYAWTRKSLIEDELVVGEKTLLYEMAEESGFDIDCEFDFELVEFIAKRKKLL